MMNESILIAELRAGSEKAFGQAYDLYAPDLLDYCFSYTKSREDSEEIVQDTFLCLWKDSSDIRNTETLKPFLYTIAHRRIIDFIRKRMRSVAFEDYVLSSSHLSYDGGVVDFDQYIKVVKQSADLLPPSQKRVFLLSRLEGLSNQEIARRLSISEKTVKNQLSLGSKAMRVILKRFLLLFNFFYISVSVPLLFLFRHII